MKIRTIKIQNFRGISEATIEKLDPKLNLLMGVNGAGKSSVLDAIALLLQSYTARLTSSAGRGLSISLYDIKKHTQGCKLIIELDNEIHWTRYRNRSLIKSVGGDLSQLYEYTDPIRFYLDSNKPICLPVIAHYGVNRAVSGMTPKFIYTRSMMIEAGKPSDTYKNWWNRGAVYNDFFRWFKEEEADENRNRILNPEYRNRGLQAIREAMKVVFPEYSEMGMLTGFQLGIKKEGENLPFEILSDGEKCYITLVCDIVRRLTIANPKGDILQGEGIVLIDEIDLHLHPSWEATVMEKLAQTFPNIQFIVSAHSPLVASHFDGKVYGLRNGNIDPFPRIFGLDYSTILMEYMGVRPDNREVSTLVDMFRTYQKHNMEKQAQAVYDKLLKLMHNDKDAESIRRLLQK